MIIDIIALTLIVVYFVRGWRKGAIVAVFSLVGVLLGIICALKLSGTFATYLFSRGWVTSGWAQIIAYVLLFVGIIWLVRLGAKLIQRSVEAVMLGTVNRLLGGLFYGLLVAVVFSAGLWLADQVHALSPETIASSKTFPYLVPVAPWVFAKIGLVLPFVRNIFTDLQHFFEGVNQQLPQHVGAH